METQQLVERPTTESLLNFILRYRFLETASYDTGYTILKRALFPKGGLKKDFNHMCDKWHHNKKDFGSFFLGSLSYERMVTLLNYWEVPVLGSKEFLERCAADHTFSFLNAPPKSVQNVRNMMLFFNNHGIDREPIPGFILEKVPGSKLRFGNSTNWGRFVLTLEDPDRFFDDLFRLYIG